MPNFGNFSKAYLVVAFARPAHTFELVEFLLSRNKKVYLFIDKPKSKSKPNELISEYVLKYYGHPNIFIRFASEPNGPQRGVEAALDWVFQTEELVVILEDDAVVNVESLDFFDKTSGIISSDVVIVSSRRIFKDAELSSCDSHSHVSRFALTNGWMTSRTFWTEHYRRAKPLRGFFGIKVDSMNPLLSWSVKSFFLSGTARFEFGMGKVGWDQKVVYTLLRDNLFSFIPNRSTVGNIGMDEAASNTKPKMGQNSFLYYADQAPPNLIFLNNPACQVLINKAFTDLYGIRYRNLFSPIKFVFDLFLRKTVSSRFRNLS